MAKKGYQITITGIVQGVGFRPFIYQLAQNLQLKGWVKNYTQGVLINVECSAEELTNFTNKIQQKQPLAARIESINIKPIKFIGYEKFTIAKSSISNTSKTALISPDLNICSECLAELFEPQNRRYRYPFINCTNCGPRYSIITDLPYDRPYTTMHNFVMCSDCEQEYHNPLDRRFHAQPNACKKCGPSLQLWEQQGNCLAHGDRALQQTVELIKTGKILAIKGLGGFHLVVDARNRSAVKKLRLLKNRPDKPFALMYPNLEQIKQDCFVSPLEEKILLSSASPIVLLSRIKHIKNNLICEEIAPKNPYLGVMLPYTPLHHLLLKELNFPIVATSGNLKDEPLCIDEREALSKLNSIADYFLVHNRPIFRPVDDSIVRLIQGEMMILRRARGYAPLPLALPNSSRNVLALGGHLKNTIAIAFNHKIFLSQHLGNLDNLASIKNYEKTIHDLSNTYDFQPEIIVSDLHPDYYSTTYGEKLALSNNKKEQISLVKVQHHLAHIFSTKAEHKVQFPFLGVAWDGTGYGLDNTIWGGEFFYITEEKIQRIASFLPFPLLGGDKAISQPTRIALALLHQLGADISDLPVKLPFMDSFSATELKLFEQMLNKRINSPLTSSIGRLFDGISALLGVVEKITFEGQAAMELEYLIDDLSPSEIYPVTWQYQPNSCSYIDWRSLIKNIINDYLSGQSLSLIAAKFHVTLVEIISLIAQKTNVKNIILTGGCFQNKYLLEQTISSLIKDNRQPCYSQQIPINDGGLALGQTDFVSYNYSQM